MRYRFGNLVRWVLKYLNLDCWFGFRSFSNVEVKWVRGVISLWNAEFLKVSYKHNSAQRSHFVSPWNLQFCFWIFAPNLKSPIFLFWAWKFKKWKYLWQFFSCFTYYYQFSWQFSCFCIPYESLHHPLVINHSYYV